MKIGKLSEFLKNEFVYGGHLLSLGAVGIVVTAAQVLGISITWDFMLITYSLIYIAYSYNRLIEFRNDHLTNPLRTKHVEKSICFLPFLIIAGSLIIVLLSVKLGNTNSVLLTIFMIAGSLLYSICFKGLTRRIVGFKSFYVSFFWASLVILLALYYSFQITFSVIAFSIFVFLRLLVNTVFFDIKDVDGDSLQGLKTLPVYFGKPKVVRLITILNVLSFIPLLFCVSIGEVNGVALTLLVFLLYTFYYLHLATKGSANIQNVSYLMVDGEYILWPIVLAISNILFFA